MGRALITRVPLVLLKLEMLSSVLIWIWTVDLFSEQILLPGILALVDTVYSETDVMFNPAVIFLGLCKHLPEFLHKTNKGTKKEQN